MADYLASAASNLAKNASEAVQQVHPYLPKDAIILNWAANEWVKLQLNYTLTKFEGGAADDGNRPSEHLVATRFQVAL